MEPLVSVIMPIYKAEKFLNRSIGSVINQTYKNLEIILVNDCSPDGSLRICKKFASNDARIKTIDKPRNEGVDLARQSGILAMTGDWTMFVDADDWLAENTIERLLTIAQQNDVHIAYCSCYRHYHSFYRRESYLPYNATNHIIQGDEKNNLLRSWFGVNILPVQLWGAIFHNSLFKPALQFSCLKLGEDLMLSMQLYQRAKAVYAVNEPLYFYRWGGVTSGHQNTMLDSAKKLYEIRLPIALSQSNSAELIRILNIELINYVASYINSMIEWRRKLREDNIQILQREQQMSIYQNLQTDYFHDTLHIAIMNNNFVEAYEIADRMASTIKARFKAALRRVSKLTLKHLMA